MESVLLINGDNRGKGGRKLLDVQQADDASRAEGLSVYTRLQTCKDVCVYMCYVCLFVRKIKSKNVERKDSWRKTTARGAG